MRIKLRYPASPENARDHAQIAVDLAREEYDAELDFSPDSLELVDSLDRLAARGGDRRGGGGGDALRPRLLPGRGDGAPPRRRVGAHRRARRCGACRRGRWSWRSPTARPGTRSGRPTSGSSSATASTCRRSSRRRPAAGAARVEGRRARRRAPGDEPFAIPITGDLDLHPFAPREIPSVVEEYVRACRERGILRLRLAHGRGPRRAARGGAPPARVDARRSSRSRTRRPKRAAGARPSCSSAATTPQAFSELRERRHWRGPIARAPRAPASLAGARVLTARSAATRFVSPPREATQAHRGSLCPGRTTP